MTDWSEVKPASDRLQKVLARAGYGSRRHCETLIEAGRVVVDGRVATLGDRVDPATAEVLVDGVGATIDPGLVHYLLQKPAGVVCTMTDPAGRPRAVDLVPTDPRVWTVGRLDVETEGLLLLTNDGAFTERLTHPSHGIAKEYLAAVEGRPDHAAVARLRTGVELDDGRTALARVSVLGDGLLRITIHEGRKRQVRRMCEAVGHPVVRLVRTQIGPLTDPKLGPGEWRGLSPEEVRALNTAGSISDSPGDRRR